MERRNGYLVIDDCMRIVADRDKNHYWVYIDNEEYYFKEMNNPYRELFGYNAAKYLGIDVCYTDLAILDGRRGIISKSLRSDNSRLISGDELLGDYLVNNFESVIDMGFVGEEANRVKEYGLGDKTRYFSSIYINNLEVIWHALEDRFKDKINIKDVMNDFILMYMFTILFADFDKHPGNWFIIEYEDKVSLAPLFDNSDILIGYEDGYDDNNILISYSTNFRDSEVNIAESLKVFFETTSYDYFLLFVSLYDKIVMNLDEVISLCERQIESNIPDNDKEKIIVSFDRHCKIIKNVIDSYGKKRL